MKPKTPLHLKVQLAFGSAILALLVVGAISYREMVLSSASDRRVRHSHEVLESLQDLRTDMGSVESSFRGFVLTGKTSYLESFRSSALNVQQLEDTIRRLTVDSAVQRSRFPALESLTAQKIQFSEMVVSLRRTQGLDTAVDAMQTGSGQRITDAFHGLLAEMRNEELRLLELRDTEAKRRLGQTKAVLILGTLLGLLIAAAAGWSVQRNFAARDLAEESLRQAAERFRDLANNMSQLAWTADDKGSIFWYNQRWFDYTGTTFEQMAGWGWTKVHHPDHVARVVEKITRCFQSGEVWEDTFPLLGKDGNYRWFLSRAVPIRDPEGNLLRWFGTNTDISERQEADKHQREMESRYRGLMEAAPDAMVVVDQDGNIVLLNVQTEKQFGYGRDELLGQHVKNIIPQGFAERLIADGTRSAAEALAQQIGTGIELSGRRKDGSEFPIEIMLSPLESAEGVLVTAAIRDISARRATDVNLAQMEGRYRGLLEAAPDAMVVVDQGGDIVLLNVQAEKQFGYNRDELLGQHVKNIIPEGFAERLIADGTRSAAEALAQQIGTGIELSGRRKDGSDFPIEIMLSPLESAEGILVTAAIRDISARRATDLNLAQMEGRYRGLLEAAPDAMVVARPNGEIVLLNLQAEKKFGYRRDELVGKKVKSIIPEGFAERLIADGTRTAAEALAQQMGNGLELSGRRKDGSEFPIEIMLSPLESAEGILVTAAVRDISLRRAAENHLAQMEGRYRGLLEAAPDAMVVVNPAGEIVLLNVQAEKQFGYRRDELVGKRVRSIIPEGFAERLIADGTRTAAEALAQQMGNGLELSGRRKDGSEFPIEIMLSPLESPEGILVTAAVRDISVRRAAENHMAQMEGRYRGLLEAAPDAMVVVNPAGEIVLLNALLHALLNLRGAIEESRAVVTHDSLPEVRADESQLVQLFQNLVGNAIKFTATGEIALRVDSDEATDKDAELRFAVSDTGVGVPLAKQETIFEAFTQADGSTTRKYGGTGLGLAISSRLVEKMSGRIWVESKPGLGSTFHFTARFLLQNKPAQKYEPVGVEMLKDLSALVVDDNAANRRNLQEMLLLWQMKPTLAESGPAALEALQLASSQKTPFRLVLLDAQMPGMDGFDVAERMTQNMPVGGPVVVMLTSAGLRGDATRCRHLGISAYLPKPVRRSDLLAAIRLALGAQNQSPENPSLVTLHSLRETRGQLKILLAEDNLINQKVAVRMLEKRGHTVIVAETGTRALEMSNQQPFDLVLMDVQMPEMDGLQTTAAIRQRETTSGKHMPIIAMTAHAMVGDRERCLQAGMDGYTSKPLQINELFAIIENVLHTIELNNPPGHSSNDRAIAKLE